MKLSKFSVVFIVTAVGMLCLSSCGKEGRGKVYNQESIAEENLAAEAVEGDSSDRDADTGLDGQNEAVQVYVQICGAVKNPGVYKLANGTRVFEAIEAAGGVNDDADTDAVNLARPVADEMQIYVPTRAEVEASDNDYFWECSDRTAVAEDNSLININKATKEELMQLPGIGASKADAIINYREENGSFSDISQIMNISGIKEAAFDKIKDLIKV